MKSFTTKRNIVLKTDIVDKSIRQTYRRPLFDDDDLDLRRINLYFDRQKLPQHNDIVEQFCKAIRLKSPKNHYVACPKVSGTPTEKQFQEYLDIYQQNQSYFRELWEKGKIDERRMSKIEEVDAWFARIPEPKPFDLLEWDDWEERERQRKRDRISSYKDTELTREKIFSPQ